MRFSSPSDLLATGGTDRVVKLWDVRAGTFFFFSLVPSLLCCLRAEVL